MPSYLTFSNFPRAPEGNNLATSYYRPDDQHPMNSLFAPKAAQVWTDAPRSNLAILVEYVLSFQGPVTIDDMAMVPSARSSHQFLVPGAIDDSSLVVCYLHLGRIFQCADWIRLFSWSAILCKSPAPTMAISFHTLDAIRLIS
jgi:hypothetical protein